MEHCLLEPIQITCISRSDYNEHPDNEITKFANSFPHKLRMLHNECWGIAIQSVSFDNNFYPPRPFLGDEETGDGKLSIKIECQLHGLRVICALDLDNKTITTPSQLVQIINNNLQKKFDQFYQSMPMLKNSSQTEQISNFFDLKWRDEEKMFILEGNNTVVIMSENLRIAFGFPSNTFNKHDGRITGTNPPHKYVLSGDDDSNLMSTKKIILYDNLTEKLLPLIIRIKMNEVDPHIDNEKWTRNICDIPVTKKMRKDAVTYFEPKIKRYFPLSKNTLSAITITLEDEDGNRARMKDGEATLVNFHLKKIPGRMEENELFHVQLSSSPLRNNGRKNLANTNSKFEVFLPEICGKLKYSDWEVALHSIFLPKDYMSINIHNREKYWIILSPENNKDYNASTHDTIFLSPVKDGSSLVTLVNVINACISAQAKNNDCYITAMAASRTFGKDSLQLVSSKPTAVHLSAHLWFLLKGEELIDKELESLPSPNSPTIIDLNWDRAACHSVLLYCNKIIPHYVGSSMEKLMDQIPIVHHDNDLIHYHYECHHLSYHRLNSSLQSMTMELKNYGRDKIEYENPQTPTIINLVFRRRTPHIHPINIMPSKMHI